MTNISPTIFRTYDIRGLVDQEINEATTYLIGQAIGSEVIEQGFHSVIQARDGRLSGEKLAKALQEGILSTGCDVIDIGLTSTPVLYFATKTLSTNCGVMLTASHNPANYNGMKIVINDQALSSENIQKLYQRILEKNFQTDQGKVTKHPLNETYLTYIQNNIHLDKPLSIVIDCANGVTGLLAPQLFKSLGCDVHALYCEVDGRFPNHEADPSQLDNLKDLIAEVKAKNADLGLAFDGDGDRVFVITHEGNVVFPDHLLMLLAQQVLEHNPGLPIVYDVKSTKHLTEVIEQLGGQPVMGKTGHTLIKAKMRGINAPLAGEMSGHVFYQDRWFGFDDGLYTAARLLEILSKQDKNLAELLSEFPQGISTPELKLQVTEETKFPIMEAIQALTFDSANIITIDGIRVEYPDGWGLVRASNTSPYLILRFEADDEASLKRIQTLFREKLLSINTDWQLPF